MEYAFELSSGNAALKADEYTDGHVDWEDFVADALTQDEQEEFAPHEFAVAQRHPSPVRYPGMPAERYWEFEDGQVNFAGAEAGVTDLLRMTVTEFALTFGNDWFVTPVRLPVGGLYSRRPSLQITDTFGITAQAGPIGPLGGVPWTLFELSAAPPCRASWAIPCSCPTASMACRKARCWNTPCWRATKWPTSPGRSRRQVQGVSGEPLDRDLEAKSLAFQQQIHFDTQPDSPQLVYRLATPVPANWTPLLPVRNPLLNLADPLEIQLARAGMKRFYPEATVEVLGAVDPDYADFLNGLDAQNNFIDRLKIDAHLRAYVFWPRGWLLRSDPTAADGPERHAGHRGRGSPAHRREPEAQVPVRAQQRRQELALDRTQQDWPDAARRRAICGSTWR